MNNNNASGGIGFFGLLTIVLIVLKILGKVTFSWLLVLAPLWIPFSIWLIIVVVVFITTMIKIK